MRGISGMEGHFIPSFFLFKETKEIMAFKKLKLKILVRVFLLLILLIGIGLFALFSIRGYRKVERFQKALAAYDAQDWPLAKKLLINAIVEDNNNETAITKLASIYQREGNWPAEAYCWERATSLNAFESSYPVNRLNAWMLAGDYARLYSDFSLKLKTQSTLTDDEQLVYILSTVRTNHQKEATEAWKKLTEKNASVKEKPIGKLLDFMFTLPTLKSDEILPKLKQLSELEDKVVAYEALRMTAINLRLNKAKPKQLEEVLKKAMEINRFLGEPAIADFYVLSYRFNDAIAIYEQYLKTFSNVPFSIALAELYFFTNQKEKLETLSKKFQSGGKNTLQVGYYMDAMLASMNNNMDAMVKAWDGTAGVFNSPLASLIALHANMQKNRVSEVEKLAIRFTGRVSFLDINDRANTMLLLYVQKLITTDKDFASAAKIAQIIYNPQKPDLLLTRILLRDKFTRNLLDDISLEAGLKTFPKDLFLLQLASEYYLSKEQPVVALKYTQRYQEAAGETVNSEIEFVRALAMIKTGKVNEGFNEFDKILKTLPDNTALLNFYLSMCRDFKRKGNLEEFHKNLAAKEEPKFREYLPFVEAEIKLLDGKTDEALDILSKVDATTNEQLMMRGAYLLGTYDRFEPALRYYNTILEKFNVDKAFILINMSEIYAATGDKAKALKAATDAWKLKPEDDNVKFCYASRLKDNNDLLLIIDVLKVPRYKADIPARVLDLWKPAMESAIKTYFDQKRYEQTLDYCRHLQIYDPDSPIAREYTLKINELNKKN